MPHQYKFGDLVQDADGKQFVYLRGFTQVCTVCGEDGCISTYPVNLLQPIPHPDTVRAKQTGWISVVDRLPEESGRFLVRYENTSEETPYTTIVRYNANNRTFRSLFLLIDQENKITHWQPLPEPPETRGK